MTAEVPSQRNAEEWCRMISVEKTVTMSEFLIAMRSGLLAESPDAKEDAINEIVDVIKLLPNDFLRADEVGMLLEFFLGRIETSALAGASVIDGIHHLVTKSSHLPANFEEVVIRFMFKEGNVQSWGRRERQLQYAILQWLLKNRLPLLQAINNDFVFTFVKTVSSERDPRCLATVFSMFLKVVENFRLGSFAEEMFETVACYFPVDFRPQPDDTITRNYLAVSCASCLVASPSFAEFCYLLIDEKLNDDDCTDDQAEDCLELMKMAANKFPPTVAISEMLAGIRKVALNPKNYGKLSPKVLEALAALIEAVKRAEKSKIDSVTVIMLENLEPFVLQAEMGLTEKALSLLKVTYEHAPDEQARKLWDQVIIWLVTLVQGDTVNSAGNKREIVTESLQSVVEWVKLAAKKPIIGANALPFFESNIFESLQVSREIAPSESLISTYECSAVYFDENCASELLIDRCRTLFASGLRTVLIPKEMLSYSKMITAISGFSLDQIKMVLNDNQIEDWNVDKVLPIICAISCSPESYELVKEKIHKCLTNLIDNKNADLKSFEDMCLRCSSNDSLVMEQVTLLDKVILDASEVSEVAQKTLQNVALYLSEQYHTSYMQTLVTRFKDGTRIEEYDRKFGLAVLQVQDVHDARTVFEATHGIDRYLFMAVNRGAVTIEKQDLLSHSANVKSLLLVNDPSATQRLSELLTSIVSEDLTSTMDGCFKYLLDYDMPECNPTKCRYKTGGGLWRQRIFFKFVPVYKSVFEKGAKYSNNLIGLMGPLLDFAKTLGDVQVKEQFAMLLPFLIQSLADSSSTLSPSLLRAIPSFINIAGTLKPVDLSLIVNKLCDVLSSNTLPMDYILDALEGLRALAKSQPPKCMHPLIPCVVKTTSPLLGHKKRLVRQKTAAIKNLWEMLTTKN